MRRRENGLALLPRLVDCSNLDCASPTAEHFCDGLGATILGASLLPWEYATSGRRRYRRSQVEVISHARQIKWHPVESD